MSTIKADAIEAATGIDTDLVLTGKGTGVPDIQTNFKVSGTAGLPLSDLRAGTAGNLITYDASGNPAAVATGTVGQVLTSGGAGVAPTMQTPTSGGELGSAYSTATGGSSIDFTGVPSDTKVIEIQMAGFSHNGTASFMVQIGDSGGIETSGYVGAVGDYSATIQYFSNGFECSISYGGGHVAELKVTLMLMDGFQWGMEGKSVRTDSVSREISVGHKSLSAALDRVRITTDSGSPTFDLNSGVAIRYFG